MFALVGRFHTIVLFGKTAQHWCGRFARLCLAHMQKFVAQWCCAKLIFLDFFACFVKAKLFLVEVLNMTVLFDTQE